MKITKTKMKTDEIAGRVVAASEVKVQDGSVIIQRGETIGAGQIEKLRCWGVTEVHVETDQSDDGDIHVSGDPVTEEVLQRFSLNERDYPPISTLISICAEEIATGRAS